MHNDLIYFNLRQDLVWIFAFIGFNAILANFLPRTAIMRRFGNTFYIAYCWFVDFIAAFAGNWRTQLPSLDQEFMGLRRITRHYVRNKLQDYADWRHRDDFPND